MQEQYGKGYVKVLPDDLESAKELKNQLGDTPLWVVSYENARKSLDKEKTTDGHF